ncbi:hypothetical protein [Bacteroides sedimenti]|uniref:Uncharacterized protein n=1 Tax=Bacteroides sedimenti TaxID=2136147 RepID=A0ABM8ICT3_9BACE
MKYLIQLLSLLLLIFISAGCADETGFTDKNYPIVTTEDATDITEMGATLNALVHNFEENEIIDYGFILNGRSKEIKYSLATEKPSKEFSMKITSSLEKGASYSYCAYTITKEKTVIGNRVVFNTLHNGVAIKSKKQ